MTDLHVTIAANIKRRREDLGLSLSDVAKRADMTKGGIWDLERGQNKNPGMRTVLNVCKALNFSINELIGMQTSFPLHPTADELREVRDNLASMILALDAKGEHHSGHYVVMLDAWANRLDAADKA